MSESWFNVGSTTGAIRVVLKTIYPWRGLGVARFMFTFEIASKQQAVVGASLWLGGRVELQHSPAQTRPYLASFQSQTQPFTLPALGVDQTLQLTLDISDRQLQLIEERRTAGVELYLNMSGYATQDGRQLQVAESQINYEISQSDWITLLQRMGHRRVLLLEMEPPDPQTHPDLAEAISYFTQAQNRYLEGEWRLTVESLRQSLASLVGKKADDEEREVEVQTSIKALRNEARSLQVAYEPRLELVRQTAKFMCDLGAHPEVAETRRHHAYGALVIVGGLLHALTRS